MSFEKEETRQTSQGREHDKDILRHSERPLRVQLCQLRKALKNFQHKPGKSERRRLTATLAASLANAFEGDAIPLMLVVLG